jgi:hypothetical protein
MKQWMLTCLKCLTSENCKQAAGDDNIQSQLGLRFASHQHSSSAVICTLESAQCMW